MEKKLMPWKGDRITERTWKCGLSKKANFFFCKPNSSRTHPK